MELRFNEFELNKNEQGQLKVSGYVNKTNQWSQTLGKQKKFVERILPGAFRKAIQTGNEIHFLAEHDNAKILSSTRNGSLNLREDENGLFMEATISDTSWGRDYHTLITDGIIKNMSFGMQVLKDSWKKLADGTYERSISDIYLAEVSAVRNPAYVQSTIQAARSIEVIEDVEIPQENNMEEKTQMVVKENRELTLEEELHVKKVSLNNYERLAEVVGPDRKLENDINKLKGEIRNMEAKIKATNQTQTSVRNENRAIQIGRKPGSDMRKIDIVKANVKKMNGKHSIVARTNFIVKKETELDVFSIDGEFLKEDMFVDELSNLPLKEIGGEKNTIKGKRAGYGIEVSRNLLNDNDVDIEESIDNKLIGYLEDGLNFSMFNGAGSMGNLNDDSSVSSIISTVEADKVSLIDVLTLIGNLNQEYREDAVFIMHTQLFNEILTNVEFKDHLHLAIDEFSGKKLYHLGEYPALVNDNADKKRIIFAALYDGYTTLVSEDSFNKRIVNDDTESARKASEKHIMDIYAGGKVTNKDCFARLDVKTA
ncbi:HK97 family phage prohead protease [Bacillus cereus]|uniref:HK97 family phage prohead protease n=3 Tax=Bacteria TaxID=2 RepID=UPI00130D9F59|nr:HK97 family phage prohead protease [Bacillus cereus]MDQ4436439.1 HK97 family phage prohead protease [Bacillus cereus]QKH67606.1 HK97 family phage prohead protease [Bacillus cereus]QKH75955.1 HK97 family phage prohead protease [Bacillus cereus]